MFSVTVTDWTTNGLTALETLIGATMTPYIGMVFLSIGLIIVFKLVGKGKGAIRRA